MDIQEDTNSEREEIYLQTEVNKGQARINYELNEVDKDVVQALQEVVKILKRVKALPPLTHHLKDVDFSGVDKLISDACKRSDEVADIRPPGCEGPYPN